MSVNAQIIRIAVSDVTTSALCGMLKVVDPVGRVANTTFKGNRINVADSLDKFTIAPNAVGTTIDLHPHSISIAAPTAAPKVPVEYEEVSFTGIAGGISSLSSGLTFTPANGRRLRLRFTDNGVAQTITPGAKFRPVGVNLPTTTAPGKTMYWDCVYNATDSVWDVVDVAGSSANYVAATSVPAGNPPSVSVEGPDASIPLFIKSKGGAGTWFLDSTTNSAIMVVSGPANTTNYVVAESTTGSTSPRITPGAPLGSNIGFDVRSLGTGAVQANGVQVEVKGHTHTVADVIGAAQWVAVPSGPAAPGTPGQLAATATHLYVCFALNSWRTIAIDLAWEG